jgi:hypothetical protein
VALARRQIHSAGTNRIDFHVLLCVSQATRLHLWMN